MSVYIPHYKCLNLANVSVTVTYGNFLIIITVESIRSVPASTAHLKINSYTDTIKIVTSENRFRSQVLYKRFVWL